MESKDIFHSPSKGKMNLVRVTREISDFIARDSNYKYKLIVGTDSNGNNGDKKADFVTAIIVHRVGAGGRYFWQKNNGDKIYHTLRDRIYQEVSLSLKVAQDLLAQLERLIKTQETCDFQIHIDVGQNGPTREMIKEVVGIVRGNGFKAKIKPESYAASNVADKYV